MARLSITATLFWAILLGLSSTSHAVSDPERYQLLAPIALYPDPLLPHVLTAAQHPGQIEAANRWVRRHNDQSTQALATAARHHGWHPGVEALIAYPHLLLRMSEDFLWTRRLGRLYSRDRQATLAAIQTLRHRAWDQGSLQRMAHQRAFIRQRQIIIQPRERLYAPFYDPQQLYGQWPWRQHPPRRWQAPNDYRSGFYWQGRARRSGHSEQWYIEWERGRIVVGGSHREHRGHRTFSNVRAAPSIGHDRHWRRHRVDSDRRPPQRYRQSTPTRRPARDLDRGADHSHVLPGNNRRPHNGKERQRHSLLPGR